jgi:hypothetical protein
VVEKRERGQRPTLNFEVGEGVREAAGSGHGPIFSIEPDQLICRFPCNRSAKRLKLLIRPIRHGRTPSTD